jgi:PKD repeat protein
VEVASYVKVNVVNRPPVASAGPDTTGYKHQNITLEGNGTDPDGDSLFYNWSQLSGEKVTIRNATSLRPTFAPGKVGNCTFQLKADDGENASYGIVNVTVLNRAPVARLEASPVQVNVNGRVNFTAAASADPDGNVTKYLIDFGDGNNTGWTSKSSTSYVYAQPGVYNATVTVMDDDGGQSLLSDAVKIAVENAKPIINASVAPEKGNISTSFRFTVSPSSYDPDGRIVSYDWNFGDGATGAGSLATHVYSKRGNYTVILKATDDFGAVSELRLPVEVAGRSPVILSVVPTAAKSVYVGESLKFSVNAQDPDGGVLSYVWKVDGEVKGSNTSDYNYRPSKTGAHKVSVTVSNAAGSVSNDWTVTVKDVEPSGGPEGWMLGAVILVIIVVVALIAAMAMRRKKAA